MIGSGIPLDGGERTTMTDSEAVETGRALALAEADREYQRTSTDSEIIEHLEAYAESEVTGWCEVAAIRAYRAERSRGR